MYLPDFELHEATSLEEATDLLARHGSGARLLAGGTDLLVDLKTGRVRCDHLISIQRIRELRGISATADSIRIGALTTVTELSRSALIQGEFASILDATRDMAATQIRNLATVGGNIASAVPCADLPPILMVLGSSVSLWSKEGVRSVPMASFYVGPRQTVLRSSETLTFIDIPRPESGFGGAYARLALRDGNAIAVASVAAGLALNEQGTIIDVRIALGAVAPTPKLVEPAGSILVGGSGDGGALDAAAAAAMEAAEPISDIRGSAEYRREMVGILTRRALQTALLRAREDES